MSKKVLYNIFFVLIVIISSFSLFNNTKASNPEPLYEVMILDQNNQTYGDDNLPVFESGKEYSFLLSYVADQNGSSLAGKDITIEFSDAIIIDSSVLGVPEGNKNIKSIVKHPDKNAVVISFNDNKVDSNGEYRIKFKIEDTVENIKKEISWKYDSNLVTSTIIIKNPDRDLPNINDYKNKSISNIGEINSIINVNIVNGKVNLSQKDGKYINYQIDYHTKGALTNSIISDEISKYLVYEEDSFVIEKIGISENGLNYTDPQVLDLKPTFEGNSFTYNIANIEANTKLKITYKASLNPEYLNELTSIMQDKYDALEGY